ncbi:MAG: hypothetical protein AB7K24_01785 [Gemmataceae bacterium]
MSEQWRYGASTPLEGLKLPKTVSRPYKPSPTFRDVTRAGGHRNAPKADDRALSSDPVQEAANELRAQEEAAAKQAPTTKQRDLIVGLDLAQASDYTALAVLERRQCAGGVGFDVVALRRWRGQRYDQLVASVAAAMLKISGVGTDWEIEQPYPLVVDGTGVGRAVVDMFRSHGIHARLIPTLITGQLTDNEATRKPDQFGYFHVSKSALVSAMEACLSSPDRFRVAQVEHAALLKRELAGFVRRQTLKGNETFEAARQSIHDDLTLACAMAAWWGSRGQRRHDPILL